MTHLKKLLRRAADAGCYLLILVSALAGGAAEAAEIQSLAWEPGSDQPVLQVRIDGDAAYKTEVLEEGQRLRISFSDSTMGNTLAELASGG